MNKKLMEISKVLLLGTNSEIQRIPLEYNVNLNELKDLLNYFRIKDSDALSVAQVMDTEKLYSNSDISTIVFNNAIIEIQNDINAFLEL